MSEESSHVPGKFEIVANIFEALDLPNADEETARCELVGRIFKTGRERHLSDQQLADLAGCTYERMAQLHAVEYDDLTIDELCRYLVALGHEVHISVAPVPIQDAHLTVAV